MKEDIIAIRYKELAVAVIEQVINDFLRNKGFFAGLSTEEAEERLYDYLTTSEWFDFLDLDGEYIYVEVIKMKKLGRKSMWYKNGDKYGKEKDK